MYIHILSGFQRKANLAASAHFMMKFVRGVKQHVCLERVLKIVKLCSNRLGCYEVWKLGQVGRTQSNIRTVLQAKISKDVCVIFISL